MLPGHGSLAQLAAELKQQVAEDFKQDAVLSPSWLQTLSRTRFTRPGGRRPEAGHGSLTPLAAELEQQVAAVLPGHASLAQLAADLKRDTVHSPS